MALRLEVDLKSSRGIRRGDLRCQPDIVVMRGVARLAQNEEAKSEEIAQNDAKPEGQNGSADRSEREAFADSLSATAEG